MKLGKKKKTNDLGKPGSGVIEGRVHEEDVLYQRYFHSEDRKILWFALAGAVIIHIIVLLLRFPSFREIIIPEKPKGNIVFIRKYIPPPPKIERPRAGAAPQKLTKKIPIPDPTPDEPEPIREMEPEPMLESTLSSDEILIGIPEAPPQDGPLIAGEEGVTLPVIIPETKVQASYPEAARKARVEGSVILQAIVKKDGTVGNIIVLRAPGHNLGFEESAITAVKQWKYKPAMKSGKPVDVYFTVEVIFSLY